MDSFPPASIETVLLVVGFVASKTTFRAFCAHQHWSWIYVHGTLVCDGMLKARADEFIGDCSVEFDGFHPFSVAQSAGGFAKSFDN
jgi:hypothetical protein